jgi:hypothetical protein
MKSIFYKLTLTLIMIAGLFVGIVKGEDAKQKWIAKKKTRHEKKLVHKSPIVILDEIEMATYHNS